MAVKIGVLLQRHQEAQGVEGWFDHVRALIDIGVAVGDGKDELVLQGRSSTGHREPSSDRTSCCATSAGTSAAPVFPSLWFPET